MEGQIRLVRAYSAENLDVRDHVELMPVDPACHAYEKKLPRLYSIHGSHSTGQNAGS